MKFQKCTIIIQLTTNNFVKTWHWTNIYCRPPRKIEFLNTYGAVINCLVHGDPIPKVQWINKNGQNVEDIHGLLKKLENNSLSLPKFDNGLYRQNIHATTYICKASNKYGTIISREIQVTAVVDQQYSTQVYDEYVIEGNTALLKCIIPSYIKDQIIVTAWIRDDGVRISSEYQQDSRYLILNTGDLNIFNVRYGDSDNVYKCQTKHTVSGEVKVTDVGGKLHVTKPSSGIQPRIVYSTPSMNIVSGSEITLSSTNLSGTFTISWCYQKYRGLSCEEITKSTEKTIVGNSLIIRASMKDSGFYVCKAENKMGDDTVKLKLTVFAPLSAFIHPQRQIVDIGQAINIGCVISGGPFTFIKWFKDGKFLKKDIEKLNSSKSSLHISNVEKTTEGMYQCFVGNVMDEKQAIGQIILSAVPPTIVKEFKMQHKRSGQSLTLECAATGDPLPQIQWILRDSIIKKSFGLNIESKVDSDDEDLLENERIKIYSNGSLKILSAIRDIDNGKYKCTAENEEGYTSSGSGILRILVAPILNEINDQSLRFGRRLSLYCSLTAGDPPIEFTWLYNGQALPHYLGLVVSDSTYSSTLNHQNIRGEHMGNYTCIAKNNPGSASVSAFIKVEAPPEWLMKPTSVEVHLGESISLPCTGKGFPQPKSTWLKLKVSVGDSCDIKCKATGIGPFNVQWIYSSKTLSSVSDQRLGSVIILFKLNTGGDNKAGSDDNKDFGYPLFTSIITPTDESYKNDSSRDVHFRSVAILYIIPTVTAAVILLVILIIVCILLQRQREKRTKYKNEDKIKEKIISFEHQGHKNENYLQNDLQKLARKLEHSNMRSQNLEEDDKISDFYKTSSVTSSSNKYYEIRPHHPYQQSHSSAFKPGISHEAKGTGPIFILEPQRKVAFLNSHGTVINCLVHGEPTPTVHWINKRNELVQDVSGLLRNLANNSLSLSKFSNGQYQQAIHATTYRCKATNKYGTIISRKVYVTAVVDQQYSTQVYDEYVIEGNTAVLKCIIPSYIKDYVKVTAWIKDDKIEITNKYEKDSKYLIMGNGNLIIIRVNMDDALSMYKCQTKHLVSKQVVITHNGGKLHITTPSSGIAPKIIESSPELQSRPGERIILPCLFQGYPSPSYSWCFKKTMKDQCKSLTDAMEERLIGSSLILTSSDKDSGFYVCVAANEMGKETSVVKLTVFDSLSVFIHPQRQMVEIGQSVSLSCVVAGGPFTSINWIKDGKFLKEDEGALASSVSILNISEVKMNSEGMYQCFVQNGQDEKQAVGQIILSAIPPSIVKTFNRKQKRPGEGVTLECSATGEPLPQMAWLLRELEIKNSSRTNIEVKEKNGKVTIKLTISFLQTEDGGMYTCMAENKVGKASYTEIMDVYGVPRVWPLVNQTVVDGKPVTINCHVSGYPIKSIYWTKDKNELLEDDSVMILKNGSLWIPSTRANIDNGKYECLAENNNGYSSTGTGYLKILVGPTLDKLTDKTLSIGDRLTLVCTIRSGPPEWARRPTTTEVNINGLVSIPCSGRGFPSTRAIWMKLEDKKYVRLYNTTTKILIFTNGTLTINNIEEKDLSTYQCKISNGFQPSLVAKLQLKLKAQRIDVDIKPNSLESPSSEPIEIKCKAKGNEMLNLRWFYGGLPVESESGKRIKISFNKKLGAIESVLSIKNTIPSDSGLYTCRVSNDKFTNSSAIYVKITDMKEDNKNFQTGLPTKESSLNPSDDRNGIKFTLMNISF
ncbi:Down syndrome cell adhesion molecule-like protein Dscam2 [Nymphon striatum]|nr:Down syndrome cell adhesion molecule-like protein Dscam2 [Nymphon striatum]